VHLCTLHCTRPLERYFCLHFDIIVCIFHLPAAIKRLNIIYLPGDPFIVRFYRHFYIFENFFLHNFKSFTINFFLRKFNYLLFLSLYIFYIFLFSFLLVTKCIFNFLHRSRSFDEL